MYVVKFKLCVKTVLIILQWLKLQRFFKDLIRCHRWKRICGLIERINWSVPKRKPPHPRSRSPPPDRPGEHTIHPSHAPISGNELELRWWEARALTPEPSRQLRDTYTCVLNPFFRDFRYHKLKRD